MKQKEPKQGDERIIEKFLFWPKTLTKFEPHDGDPRYYSNEEWRWLRYAKIKQVWCRYFVRKVKRTCYDIPACKWVDDCWVDEN